MMFIKVIFCLIANINLNPTAEIFLSDPVLEMDTIIESNINIEITDDIGISNVRNRILGDAVDVTIYIPTSFKTQAAVNVLPTLKEALPITMGNTAESFTFKYLAGNRYQIELSSLYGLVIKNLTYDLLSVPVSGLTELDDDKLKDELRSKYRSAHNRVFAKATNTVMVTGDIMNDMALSMIDVVDILGLFNGQDLQESRFFDKFLATLCVMDDKGLGDETVKTDFRAAFKKENVAFVKLVHVFTNTLKKFNSMISNIERLENPSAALEDVNLCDEDCKIIL